MAWPLVQRTNAAVPWATATPTPSIASTVSTLASPMSSVGSTSSQSSMATPMSSVGSTSSQMSTAAVQRPAGLQTALPTPAQLANAFGTTWGRGRRKTRRGGGAVVPGTVCTYPSQAEKDAGQETREFEEGELVCVGSATGTTHITGTYLRTDTTGDNVRHRVKIHATYPNGHLIPWWSIGKYIRPGPSSSSQSPPAMFFMGQTPVGTTSPSPPVASTSSPEVSQSPPAMFFMGQSPVGTNSPYGPPPPPFASAASLGLSNTPPSGQGRRRRTKKSSRTARKVSRRR